MSGRKNIAVAFLSVVAVVGVLIGGLYPVHRLRRIRCKRARATRVGGRRRPVAVASERAPRHQSTQKSTQHSRRRRRRLGRA